jgi:hypothetical protein
MNFSYETAIYKNPQETAKNGKMQNHAFLTKVRVFLNPGSEPECNLHLRVLQKPGLKFN